MADRCLLKLPSHREVTFAGADAATPSDGNAHSAPSLRVLFVGDSFAARRSLTRMLANPAGVVSVEAASVAEARRVLSDHEVDVALIDLRLSGDCDSRDALALIEETSRRSIVTLALAESNDLGDMRAAMRCGAYDYLVKGRLTHEALRSLFDSIRNDSARHRDGVPTPLLRERSALHALVGGSPLMKQLREQLRLVASSPRPVLVTGPTGVGKELAVRAIHALGPNGEAPFVALNCAAFPAALIDSQLFGHERGAFTGAERRQEGFLAAVGGGTLFLDEIAELPLELQVKLLRVLETGSFRPIGAMASKRFSGRIVAATHAALDQAVAARLFREDLYYRLNVLEIRLPSLEQRREDIPALVAHFAAQMSRPLLLTDGALARLQARRWPGNVRELRNVIDRLAVFAPDGPISEGTLEQLLQRRDVAVSDVARDFLIGNEAGAHTLRTVEAALIHEAMRLAGGNKTAAARLLGVDRKVIERRLERERDDEADDCPSPLSQSGAHIEQPSAPSSGDR